MKRTNKTFTLLILGIVVITILIGRQITLKMKHHLNELDKEIAQHKIQLKNALSENTINKDYEKKWNDIQGFRNEAIEDLQNKFTAYLQSLETERKFYFTSLGSPIGRPMNNSTEFQVLSYDLSFYAHLDDLVEFIGQLDASEKLLRIDRLKISRRIDYPARYESMLPSTLPLSSGELSVEMTVSIPAPKPPAETTTRKDAP